MDSDGLDKQLATCLLHSGSKVQGSGFGGLRAE